MFCIQNFLKFKKFFFIKQILFSTFSDLLTLNFLLHSDRSKCSSIKRQQHVSRRKFYFGKLIFLNLTSSNSTSYYAIVLKLSSVKQINSNMEEKCAICETMNINVDFRIFMNASHSAFFEKPPKHKSN